jgi:mono/diheme cytochrome c family protein
MKNTARGILILAATLLVSTTAFSQQKSTDLGKREFENSCGVCHGMDAKGSGLLTASLKVVPSDLTLLTKNNGGVFPIDRISRVIDGRTQVAAHGSVDMPIWGTRYAVNAAEHYVDVPYDQEAYIRNRILNLTDYLYRIQQK